MIRSGLGVLSRRLVLLVGSVFAVTALGGCVRGDDQPPTPSILATTTVVADLVRAVAADRLTVDVLMGPEIDPHTYRVTPGDVARIRSATLIFYNGLNLEGTLGETLNQIGPERAIPVTRDLDRAKLLAWEEADKTFDPHVWHDPTLWAECALLVGRELARLQPEHAEEFIARAARLAEEYRGLAAEISQTLAVIPPQQRLLITSHDAFAYFGRAFDLEVMGVQGISTAGEVGTDSIRQVVEKVYQRRLPAIFVETSVNPQAIERVQADLRSRGHAVRIGGMLYSDALGSPGEHEAFEVHTLPGMLRYNAATIAQALTPQAP